jgi:hypothetical protein
MVLATIGKIRQFEIIDLDRDGLDDLITCGSQPDRVLFLKNTGFGYTQHVIANIDGWSLAVDYVSKDRSGGYI